jgi:methyltransferase
MRLLLAAGWALQLVSFTVALRRSGRRAAAAGEWGRELALRGVMAGLVVAALADPRPPAWPLPGPAGPLLAAAALAGHILTAWARASLGPSWGIGVEPRGPPAAGGPYRRLRHPIYAGTGLALLAQAALLQNPAALALAAGAALVIPAKALEERRRLAGRR